MPVLRPPAARLARMPRSSLPLAIAATLAVLASVGLVVETIATARRHRGAATQVLRDHAQAAGWRLATEFDAALESEVLAAVGPELTSPTTTGIRTISVEEVRQWAERAAPCPRVSVDSARFYYRVLMTDRSVRILGATPPPEVDALLRDSLARWVSGGPGRWGIRSHGPSGPDRRALVFAVQRDPDGTPAAIVGFDTCQAWIFGTLAKVIARRPLLPPFLVGDSPPDSLISVVAVRQHSADTVFRSAVRYPDRYQAVTPSAGVGGLTFAVALNPAIASRLIIGGLPESRLPWLLALLTITGLSFAIVIVQLRQGLRLARAQHDFVTGVSHEIRTPLTQILLFGESLKYGTARTATDRAFAIDVIVDEANRLIHLAANVLHLSRRNLDRVAPIHPPVALAPLVRQAVAAFEPLVRARRATFHLELEDVDAAVDPGAVRQVLINLLDNAVKFGPDDHRIEIALRPTPAGSMIEVADRGPGVAEADRAAIWEPFTRGAAVGRQSGSGIGLAVVRDLVVRNGGDVEVAARDGGGARFIVRLPAVGGARR